MLKMLKIVLEHSLSKHGCRYCSSCYTYSPYLCACIHHANVCFTRLRNTHMQSHNKKAAILKAIFVNKIAFQIAKNENFNNKNVHFGNH